MEYGASSRPKRILSDIILTFGQLRRKSTLPYFLAIFGVYFVFPVYNLMNGKFSLTGFPAERSLSAYASAAGLLLLFSLVHLLYISSITSYFEHVSLLSFLKNCKLKLMQGIGLIFGIMLVYAISNINSTPVDFSSGGVWTGVFFNYLKLYTAYFLLAFGSILLVDKKSVREILGHFSVKSFFIMIIKVLITIVLIDLLSSPFVYYIESQLIMGDPFASSSAAYSWIYFVLECLINSAVVMLLYNYIELLIHKKNRRILHPGAYKKIILLCLVFIYLFIWFTCGIAFQAMARTSNGNAFIYQEDITMNLEAKALKDMMNIKADIYTVFDLLKNNEFSREVAYHDSGSGIT
ncbi:MAG: hypothetical protein HGA22_06830, partial [Clostridiales bacterium]|nr:hypothetical protein [Clostridiales bacterium]